MEYKDGIASTGVYLVLYKDVEWCDEKAIEFTPIWRQNAIDAEVKYLVVKTTPDELFGEGKPIIKLQENVSTALWVFDEQTHVKVMLRNDVVFNDSRDKILSQLRLRYKPKTTYSIESSYAGVVEQGIV